MHIKNMVRVLYGYHSTVRRETKKSNKVREFYNHLSNTRSLYSSATISWCLKYLKIKSKNILLQIMTNDIVLIKSKNDIKKFVKQSIHNDKV